MPRSYAAPTNPAHWPSAIPQPDGSRNSAIDLDGFFGLHPSLAPLKPLYDAQHLAIVEALLARDVKAASRAMARHINSGSRYWSRAMIKENG